MAKYRTAESVHSRVVMLARTGPTGRGSTKKRGHASLVFLFLTRRDFDQDRKPSNAGHQMLYTYRKANSK